MKAEYREATHAEGADRIRFEMTVAEACTLARAASICLERPGTKSALMNWAGKGQGTTVRLCKLAIAEIENAVKSV